ncbi:hypothetical protein DRN34_02715 [Thermococci archaeon]|nr:MAG: hypothetical protein DRN34_02715 [Thermococci archaeon]
MRILYVTDLHGIKWKFERIVDRCAAGWSKDVDLLIVGADILPKNQQNVHKQQFGFLTKYLPRFFDSIQQPIIIDFGNDDHKALYKTFRDLIDMRCDGSVYYSHMRSFKINGVTFAGMHYVPDYPFRIKDWVRADHSEDDHYDMDTFQYGEPILSTKDGYEKIANFQSYLDSHTSLNTALSTLGIPDVLLAHSPPRMLGLDVCSDMREVGSRAITEYILKNAPKLTLHGHIHESHYMTGTDMGSLTEGSISIQPGQNGISQLTYCEFDLDDIAGTYIRQIRNR